MTGNEVHQRLAVLPERYQLWVIRKAQGRGIPTLRPEASLGAGELVVYDALIFRCERELCQQQDPTTKETG